MTPSPEQLAQLAATMRANFVSHVQGEHEGEGFVIDLHPSAFAAVPIMASPEAVALKPEEAERCHCGHENYSEHNDSNLCLRGCPVSLCQPETVKPKE